MYTFLVTNAVLVAVIHAGGNAGCYWEQSLCARSVLPSRPISGSKSRRSYTAVKLKTKNKPERGGQVEGSDDEMGLGALIGEARDPWGDTGQ